MKTRLALVALFIVVLTVAFSPLLTRDIESDISSAEPASVTYGTLPTRPVRTEYEPTTTTTAAPTTTTTVYVPPTTVRVTTTTRPYVPPTTVKRQPAPTTTAAPQAATQGSIPAFLACVRQRESGSNYQALNPSGAAGAYQLMPATARNTANHAGRPDLAARPVLSWSPADQDAMAMHLLSWQGRGPWAGGQYSC